MTADARAALAALLAALRACDEASDCSINDAVEDWQDNIAPDTSWPDPETRLHTALVAAERLAEEGES